ncbi:MAG: hypothetical protein Q8R48_03740, partial [Candidatus Omnitrophota bacterium]|nr:hypothetical protein [Candidatus Omnitrophota bacterium]
MLSEIYYKDDPYAAQRADRRVVNYIVTYEDAEPETRVDYEYKQVIEAGKTKTGVNYTLQYNISGDTIPDNATAQQYLTSKAVYMDDGERVEYTIAFRNNKVTDASAYNYDGDRITRIDQYKASYGSATPLAELIGNDINIEGLESEIYYRTDDYAGVTPDIDESKMIWKICTYDFATGEEKTRSDYYYQTAALGYAEDSAEKIAYVMAYNIEGSIDDATTSLTHLRTKIVYKEDGKRIDAVLGLIGGTLATWNIYHYRQDAYSDKVDFIEQFSATGTLESPQKGTLGSVSYYVDTDDEGTPAVNEMDRVEYVLAYDKTGLNAAAKSVYQYQPGSAELLSYILQYNVRGDIDDVNPGNANLTSKTAYEADGTHIDYVISLKGIGTAGDISYYTYRNAPNQDQVDKIVQYKTAPALIGSPAPETLTSVNITQGIRKSEIYYSSDNAGTQGVDESERINYIIQFDNATGNTKESISYYHYQPGSAVKIEDIRTYDLNNLAFDPAVQAESTIAGTRHLSDTVYTADGTKIDHVINYIGGSPADWNEYEYRTETALLDKIDFITQYDAVVEGTVITRGGTVKSTIQYVRTDLTPADGVDDLDRIDYVWAYGDDGLEPVTKSKYNYQNGSTELIDYILQYNIKGAIDDLAPGDANLISKAVYLADGKKVYYVITAEGLNALNGANVTGASVYNYDGDRITRIDQYKASYEGVMSLDELIGDYINLGVIKSEIYYWNDDEDWTGAIDTPNIDESKRIYYINSFDDSGVSVETRSDYTYQAGSVTKIDNIKTYKMPANVLSSVIKYENDGTHIDYILNIRNDKPTLLSEYEYGTGDNADKVAIIRQYGVSGTIDAHVNGKLKAEVSYVDKDGTFIDKGGNTIDDRDGVKYVISYDADGITKLTRSDYAYQFDSTEKINTITAYNIEGMNDYGQKNSTAEIRSFTQYLSDGKHIQYVAGYEDGATKTYTTYQYFGDTNPNDGVDETELVWKTFTYRAWAPGNWDNELLATTTYTYANGLLTRTDTAGKSYDDNKSDATDVIFTGGYTTATDYANERPAISTTEGISYKDDQAGQTTGYYSTYTYYADGEVKSSTTRGFTHTTGAPATTTGGYTTEMTYNAKSEPLISTTIGKTWREGENPATNPESTTGEYTTLTEYSAGEPLRSTTEGIAKASGKQTGYYSTFTTYYTAGGNKGKADFSTTHGISHKGDAISDVTGEYTTETDYDTEGMPIISTTKGLSLIKEASAIKQTGYYSTHTNYYATGEPKASTTHGYTHEAAAKGLSSYQTTGEYTTETAYTTEGEADWSTTKGVAWKKGNQTSLTAKYTTTTDYATTTTQYYTKGAPSISSTDGISIKDGFQTGYYSTHTDYYKGVADVSTTHGYTHEKKDIGGTGSYTTTGEYTTNTDYATEGDAYWAGLTNVDAGDPYISTTSGKTWEPLAPGAAQADKRLSGQYTTSTSYSSGNPDASTTEGTMLKWNEILADHKQTGYYSTYTDYDAKGDVTASTTYGYMHVAVNEGQLPPYQTTGGYTTATTYSSGDPTYTQTEGRTWNNGRPDQITGEYTTKTSYSAGDPSYSTTEGASKKWYVELGISKQTGYYSTYTKYAAEGNADFTTTHGITHEPDMASQVTGEYTTKTDYTDNGMPLITTTDGVTKKNNKQTGYYSTHTDYLANGDVNFSTTHGITHKEAAADQTTGEYTTETAYLYGEPDLSTTKGKTWKEGNNAAITGKYTTKTDYDAGEPTVSTTDGFTYKDVTDGVPDDENKTSSYNTETTFSGGEPIESTTAGFTYSYNVTDGSYVTGKYTTHAAYAGAATQSSTWGRTFADGLEANITGAYTTETSYNKDNEPTFARTLGISSKKGQIANVTGEYTSDTYYEAGEPTQSSTIGITKQDGVKTGDYSTVTTYAEGLADYSTTKGVSYKKGTTDKVVGAYTTETDYEAGAVAGISTTIGKAYEYNDQNAQVLTGIYTTKTSYDAEDRPVRSTTEGIAYKTLTTTTGIFAAGQYTTGSYITKTAYANGVADFSTTEGISKTWDGKTSGTYTTETDFNETQNGEPVSSVTKGTSLKDGSLTGTYATTTEYSVSSGEPTASTTTGKSFYIYSGPNTKQSEYSTYVIYLDGEAQSSATYGTVYDRNDESKSIGLYTTNTTYNDGEPTVSTTDGVSWDKYDDRPVKDINGTYYTNTTYSKPFGTPSSSMTVGDTWDKYTGGITGGIHTGTYVTNTAFNLFSGDELISTTHGYSYNRFDAEEMTGEYTTETQFENGNQKHSYTQGLSYEAGVGVAGPTGEYDTDTYYVNGETDYSSTHGFTYDKYGRGEFSTGEYYTYTEYAKGSASYSKTDGKAADKYNGNTTSVYTTETFYYGSGDTREGEVRYTYTTGNTVDKADGTSKTGQYETKTWYKDGLPANPEQGVQQSYTYGKTWNKYDANKKRTGEYTTELYYDAEGKAELSYTLGETYDRYTSAKTGGYSTTTEYADGEPEISTTEGWGKDKATGKDTGAYITYTGYDNGEPLASTTEGKSLDRHDGVTLLGEYTTITSYDQGRPLDSTTHGYSYDKFSSLYVVPEDRNPDNATGEYTTTTKFSESGEPDISTTRGLVWDKDGVAPTNRVDRSIGEYTTETKFSEGEADLSTTTGSGYDRYTGNKTSIYSTYTKFSEGDAVISTTIGETADKFTANSKTGTYTSVTYFAVNSDGGKVKGERERTRTQGTAVDKFTGTKTGWYSTTTTYNASGIAAETNTTGETFDKNNEKYTGTYTTISTFTPQGDANISTTWGFTTDKYLNAAVTGRYTTITLFYTAENITQTDINAGNNIGDVDSSVTSGAVMDKQSSNKQIGTYLSVTSYKQNNPTETITTGSSYDKYQTTKLTGVYRTTTSYDTAGDYHITGTWTIGDTYDRDIPGQKTGHYTTSTAFSLQGEPISSGTDGRTNDRYTGEVTGKYYSTTYYKTSGPEKGEKGDIDYTLTRGNAMDKYLSYQVTGVYATITNFSRNNPTDSRTTGVSIDRRGRLTGSYTTDSYFDTNYGEIQSSVTYGVAYDRFYDSLMFDYDGEAYTYNIDPNIPIAGDYATTTGFYETRPERSVTDGRTYDIFTGEQTGQYNTVTEFHITQDLSTDSYPGDVKSNLTTGETYDRYDGKKTGAYTTATSFVRSDPMWTTTDGLSYDKYTGNEAGGYKTVTSYYTAAESIELQIPGLPDYAPEEITADWWSEEGEPNFVGGTFGDVNMSTTAGWTSDRHGTAKYKKTGEYTSITYYKDSEATYSHTTGTTRNKNSYNLTGTYMTDTLFGTATGEGWKFQYHVPVKSTTFGIVYDKYLSADNESVMTGEYTTTTAYYTGMDDYDAIEENKGDYEYLPGDVVKSATEGISYNRYSEDPANPAKIGDYTTTTSFWQNDPVLSTTKGNSYDVYDTDDYGRPILTGEYTTVTDFYNAEKDVFDGDPHLSLTEGESYDHSRRTGLYTTRTSFIDGEIAESSTTGETYDRHTSKLSGRYSTVTDFADEDPVWSTTIGKSYTHALTKTDDY